MTEEEIIKRLTWVAEAKIGEPLPEWMGGPTNNWGPPLSELAKETLNLIKDYEAQFDLRWNADIRAIKRWQEATGRTKIWPDHADLCVWLLDELDKK